MDSLITRERTEAKKKGVYAAAAWGGTVLLGIASGPLLAIPAADRRGVPHQRVVHVPREARNRASNRPPRNQSATHLALSRQGDGNDAERSLRSRRSRDRFWRVGIGSAVVATRVNNGAGRGSACSERMVPTGASRSAT